MGMIIFDPGAIEGGISLEDAVSVDGRVDVTGGDG